MNVLLINASPRAENGNTYRVTEAFLNGIKEAVPDAKIEKFNLKDLNIKPCSGCLCCWGPTPGVCSIKNDDAAMMIEKVKEADIIIQSYGLYFFGMPGPMKTFIDRMMPLMKTYRGFIKDFGEKAFHEPRYDFSGKKFIVISTCGYARTEEIYDSVIKQYNFIFGKGHYLPLFCAQGEMFAKRLEFRQRVPYLKNFSEVGKLVALGQEIPAELLEKTQHPIMKQNIFEMLINKYWDERSEKGE